MPLGRCQSALRLFKGPKPDIRQLEVIRADAFTAAGIAVINHSDNAP